MSYALPKSKQDSVFENLSEEQQQFISSKVKRGKKTAFAQIMAKEKGYVLPMNATEDEIEMLLDDWILIDYVDEGSNWKNTSTSFCECGLKLRYQYVVQHKKTRDTKRFGETHFKEHSNFDDKLINDIRNGFRTIDYEFDEIIFKILNGWDNTIVKDLPFELPNDIQLYIHHDIPLLDRQIETLKSLKSKYRNEIDRPKREINDNFDADKDITIGNVFQQEFFSFDIPNGDNSNSIAFSYLENGVESTRLICELLIKNHGYPKKRFSSGKPTFYIDIVSEFLELVENEIIEIKEIVEQDDVLFHIK